MAAGVLAMSVVAIGRTCPPALDHKIAGAGFVAAKHRTALRDGRHWLESNRSSSKRKERPAHQFAFIQFVLRHLRLLTKTRGQKLLKLKSL